MDTPSYQQLTLENQQLRERNTRLEQTVRELLHRIDAFRGVVGSPFNRTPADDAK